MKEFNISTNIIRDENSEINYIVTKNAVDNFEKIVTNYNNNNKFQSIIGSYGTGKSSFLWALEKNLDNDKNYFGRVSDFFKNIGSFDFIKIIGEYDSLSSSIIKALDADLPANSENNGVLDLLKKRIDSNTKKNTITVLIIDEFGKFLEYATQNNPDKEVYFIQKLAEFFNDKNKLAFAISSLHQNFSSYGNSLNLEQVKEWEKVKGRLKEIAFNEPIDQLLHFSSERNQFKNQQLAGEQLNLFNLIKKKNVSDKKNLIDTNLAKSLLPIDYISAEIMAKSLQRYGQNERSLFSFLDINEQYSFKWFYNSYKEGTIDDSNYNLSHVYNYIMDHYYFIIASKSNTDLTLWNAIKTALDQVDTRLHENHVLDGRKIIKTIGLLNIFCNAGASIDERFISSYAKIALDIKDSKEVIEKLISHKIISFKKYKNRFVFLDWTDLDIDFELQQASQKIKEIHSVSERITELDLFNPILVKQHYFKTGTPRLFEYVYSDIPVSSISGATDGLINYVFPNNTAEFNLSKQPILHVVFDNTVQIKSLFFEIDKAKKVIEENDEDRSAVKELNERIFYIKKELKELLVDAIYRNNDVTWYFNEKKIAVNNKIDFTKILNDIFTKNYSESPILKNELINKTKLSTPISTARRNLINHLILHREKENLGFPSLKFPPEKTIYLSLIKQLKIHRFNTESNCFELGEPDFTTNDTITNSFKTLWDTSISFLNSSKTDKKSIQAFIDVLSKPPLKLKRGFIDFWVPIFLITQKNEYALFNQSGYVPNIDTEVFDVIYKSPHKYSIKAFDLSGIKLEVFNRYKSILNAKAIEKPTEKDFIATIKPFIIFTRTLNYYSLNTKNLTQQSIDLRHAISNAKEPEKAFFVDFPNALNYSEALQTADSNLLEGFVEKMESCINEMRSSYDDLLNRFEVVVQNTLSDKKLNFKKYKKALNESLKTIDASILGAQLRNLQRKCISPSNDRKIFLEGIAFAILGKGLDKIKDSEEKILHKDFVSNYKRLVEMVELHTLRKSFPENNILRLNVLNEKGIEKKHQVIVPHSKKNEIKKYVQQINSNFINIDKDLKKVILLELLKQELDE